MNIEATAKQIMSARHSDAFTQEACEQILREAQQKGGDASCQPQMRDGSTVTETSELTGNAAPNVQPAGAAQPKPESWQEIAREARKQLCDWIFSMIGHRFGHPKSVAPIDGFILSAIERSHAAQSPQRSVILERARELLDHIDTVKLATKGFAADATAISGARVALDALAKQFPSLRQFERRIDDALAKVKEKQ